jgi:dephospho-CoA kinase
MTRLSAPSARKSVAADGRLNRARLAELAFQGGRLNELNAIVHPAVIAAQRQWMDAVFARDPAAVAVVESALIFEVERDARARGEKREVLADWRRRIDRVVVVTAPDELKIARYAARVSQFPAARAAAEADATPPLPPDSRCRKSRRADYVLDNTGDKAALRARSKRFGSVSKPRATIPAKLVFRIGSGSRASRLWNRPRASRICCQASVKRPQ